MNQFDHKRNVIKKTTSDTGKRQASVLAEASRYIPAAVISKKNPAVKNVAESPNAS